MQIPIYTSFLFTFVLSLFTNNHSSNCYLMRRTKNEKIVLKSGQKDLKLDYAELRQAVLTLRAISHPSRREVIDLLKESDKLTVTEIYIKLRLEQSIVSQHLSVLRKVGIVNASRDGKKISYYVNANKLRLTDQLVETLG